MIYYCLHYNEKINRKKFLNFCLKSNCWAAKILKNHIEYKKYKKKGGGRK